MSITESPLSTPARSSVSPQPSPVRLVPPPPAPAGPRTVWLGAAFAVIYLVWGSTFLGIKVAVETLPPLGMCALRFVSSSAVLLAASAGARPWPSLRQWRNAAVIGGLFFLGNHGFLSIYAHAVPSSVACIIIATEVPVIAVLSSLLLPDRPLTRRALIGAALGIGGVGWLLSAHEAGSPALPLWPCVAIWMGALSWALGVVLSQRLELPAHPVRRAAMQMLCGGALLAVASALRGESVQLAAFSARSLAALAYLILFGSVLAFACYTWLLKQVRAEKVATHVFVNPIVAVALGAWLGGEHLVPAQLAAVGVILSSVAVILGGGVQRTR